MPEQPDEKVLIFAGPSLDEESIREVLPQAIILPPAKQGDVISSLMEYEPSHVLLLEGTFHQSLSVWHKELAWALQIPGVKGVYGAASMGALRAADLADFGMIGSGRIFNWYYEGVIFDESEVAAVYQPGRNELSFTSYTIPLVNVRGALLKALETEVIKQEEAQEIFTHAAAIHWTERTERSLAEHPTLLEILLTHNQKKIDALELLYTFRDLKPVEGFTPFTEEALSLLFSAQFERDRTVFVGARAVRLQDLEAFVMLHDQEYEEHLAAADDRVLALLLADIYRISVTVAEIDDEWRRFSVRMGLRSLAEHDQWMRENHVNGKELMRLIADEVRLRKLRKALMTRSGPRRRTQRLLDYLKLTQRYRYWSNAAARHEEQISSVGGEETLYFGQTDVSLLLSEHAKKAGLTITLSLEDYVREMGFGTVRELMVALARDKLADADIPR
jgi:hypothetical protein